MATSLQTLRTELNEYEAKGAAEVSIHVLRAAINELERVSQLQEAQAIELEAYLQIGQELDILRSQAMKIQIERDTVVELHKQTVLALKGGQLETTTQDSANQAT